MNRESSEKTASTPGQAAWRALGIASVVAGLFFLGYVLGAGVLNLEAPRELPLFGREGDPLPLPDLDYLADKPWTERTGVFLSSLDGKPELPTFVSFKTSPAAGGSAGSRRITFRYDREGYVRRQFDRSDRSWSILLFTEIWRLVATNPRAILAPGNLSRYTFDPAMTIGVPLTLSMTEPRYAVYLEVAFQVTSLTDKTRYQFVSTRRLAANGLAEEALFPLDGFVLDRTYQPAIPVDSIKEGDAAFDEGKSGIAEQIQFKLVFTDPVPESLDQAAFAALEESASASPSDALMVRRSYQRADDGFVLGKHLGAQDLIRLAAIRHVSGFDATGMGDAAGEVTFGNPIISANRPIRIMYAASAGIVISVLLFLGIAALLLALHGAAERRKRLVRQLLTRHSLESARDAAAMEALVTERDEAFRVLADELGTIRAGLSRHRAALASPAAASADETAGAGIDEACRRLGLVASSLASGAVSPSSIAATLASAGGREREVPRQATAPVPGAEPIEFADLYELNPRERSVLDLLVEGRSDKAIADALGISPRTVSNNVARMLRKTGLESRYALALLARGMPSGRKVVSS